MSQTPGSLADYFAMGGYAAFIWPSYALAVLLLVGLFLLSARRLGSAERSLDREAGDEAGDGNEGRGA